MNSKIAFRNTLQIMNTGRMVFVPFVYGVAAKIGQITLSEMVSDPTYYANSLEGAYKLLRYDAIVTGFDPGIEAEIFGCQSEWGSDYEAPAVNWSSCEPETASLEKSSRIPVMLEATKRLVITLGKELAIIGVVTGPCSLVKNLAEHAKSGKENIISTAGGLLTKLTKSLCERRVDAIFLREDLLGEKYHEELLSLDKAYMAAYATLFNLVKYFNIYTVLIVKEQRLEAIEDLCKRLRPSGMILCGKRVNQDDLVYLKKLSDSAKVAFGLSLPLEDKDELANQYSIIQDFANKHKPKGFFYTTDGEVPHTVPLEIIRDLTAKIVSL